MNTRGSRQVEPIIRWLGVALATLLSCPLHGCTNVSGGAIELTWHLEDLDGSSRECVSSDPTKEPIDKIRLWWQVDTERTSEDFDCSKYHGVTSFVVPRGQALVWVEPECLGGTPVNASAFMAPAPIARTINVGDVVELHAVVITIDANTACK